VKKKIWCFSTGQNGSFHNVVALCEDGVIVAGHTCSEPAFFEGDIGITTIKKHEAYDSHCGKDNWTLQWVDNPIGHEGVQAAIAENAKLFPASAITKQPTETTQAFSSDDITVGELVRFINAACVAASRENDQDKVHVLALLGGQIEYAYNLYKQTK